MWAAIKAWRAVELATDVVAIEIMAACQGLDLLAPLQSSARLSAVHRAVRVDVPTLDRDRPPSPDIARIAQLITSGAIEAAGGGLQ
jgi:histidine ammonia-lyase